MRPAFRLLLPFALLSPATAQAADYDPPLVIEQDPIFEEVVPVEIGSGWYLRGDISYTLNRQRYNGFDFLNIQPMTNIRVGGGVGAGYHFNEWFRMDGQLAFIGSDYANIRVNPLEASASRSAWTGMLNAYVDLGTIAKFTPYLGAGVGLMRTKNTMTLRDPRVPVDATDTNTNYRFAYSAEAGVSYRVTNNVSVDVGYRFLAAPQAEQVNFNTGAVTRGVTHHQIRAGLRLDLW